MFYDARCDCDETLALQDNGGEASEEKARGEISLRANRASSSVEPMLPKSDTSPKAESRFSWERPGTGDVGVSDADITTKLMGGRKAIHNLSESFDKSAGTGHVQHRNISCSFSHN